jgi:outer membrane biosynthesis protein TonB
MCAGVGAAQSKTPQPYPSKDESGECAAKALGSTFALPEVVFNPNAVYPNHARRRNTPQIVRIEISWNGDVVEADAVDVDPELRDIALATVRSWKFKPFAGSEKPVKTILDVPIYFNDPHKPEPEPPAPFREAAPLREGDRIRTIQASYPPDAKAARISGQVLVKLVIGSDGKVCNSEPVYGPELLVQSAIEATKQWVYVRKNTFQPYVTYAILNFTLSD